MSTPLNSAATIDGSAQPPAQRFCDIVMKGGITSGVVYPPAIVELSKTYTFKNIGGTSAGAIAAAVTAAAEYGRQQGTDGFGVVAELPQWLGQTVPNGKDSNLFSLFQPQRQTKPLFRVLIAGIGNKKFKSIRILLAILRNAPVYALLGALPGLLLAYRAYSVYSPATRSLVWWTFASAALIAIVGSVALSVFGLYRRVTTAVPNNGFGICSGLSQSRKNRQTPLALTTWLSHLLNRAAGMREQGRPLTFGDLWQASEDDRERNINLQMMTTNLTHGRPYRLPFAEKVFYFDPAEFRDLFPEEVVSWMETHPRESTEPDEYLPLRRLPEAADLPVVVATRMSLSFPFLLSAVPLYAIDYGRRDAKDHIPEKCWFSDGGICSNFPVHFFDSALPRWPSFAINLRPYHLDYPDSPVWMPRSNRGGITAWWTRFDSGRGVKRLGGFLNAILNSMQNWMDNTQTGVPGYRDRVVHISMDDEKEGGINLNMPPPIIKALSDRGCLAGTTLIERFTSSPDQLELSWDNQRWVRYRSLMRLLEQLLEDMDNSFSNTRAGEQSYWDLIRRGKGAAPKSYPWNNQTQQKFADDATKKILDLAQEWRKQRDSEGAAFGGVTPNPQPELRIRPRI